MARENIPCALILEDDFHIIGDRRKFRENLGARLLEASRAGSGWDLLYIGHAPHEEHIAHPSPSLADPGYSLWTVGYVLKRIGALKLLAAEGIKNMAPLDEYLSVIRSRPLCDPPWCHDRAREWVCHIPGGKEGELRGLACHPPLVMPFHEFTYLSDTGRLRGSTRYLRDLPTEGAPCVLEDPSVEEFWKDNPPPSPPKVDGPDWTLNIPSM